MWKSGDWNPSTVENKRCGYHNMAAATTTQMQLQQHMLQWLQWRGVQFGRHGGEVWAVSFSPPGPKSRNVCLSWEQVVPCLSSFRPVKGLRRAWRGFCFMDSTQLRRESPKKSRSQDFFYMPGIFGTETSCGYAFINLIDIETMKDGSTPVCPSWLWVRCGIIRLGGFCLF